MKKILVFFGVLLAFLGQSFAQTNPQTSFYANADYTSNSKFYNGDFDEYLTLRLLVLLDDNLSKRQIASLYYRIYTIEHLSIINCRLVNGESLNFRTSQDSLNKGILVDFGSTLESCYMSKDGGEILYFKSPVTRIDPKIFCQQLCSISLPSYKDMEYSGSLDINTKNLYRIESPDAEDHRALVSKNGTLIVAALADTDSYSLPSSVKTIGVAALRGSMVKNIFVPASVSRIEDNSFELCDNLGTITLASSRPVALSNKIFGDKNRPKTRILVPANLLKQYKKNNPSLKRNFYVIE